MESRQVSGVAPAQQYEIQYLNVTSSIRNPVIGLKASTTESMQAKAGY